MAEVPRCTLGRTPCVPLFSTLFLGVEAEGLLDYQGRAGIISIARWNLRPVIFGAEPSPQKKRVKQAQCGKLAFLLGNGAHFGHFQGFLAFLAIATRKPYLCFKFQSKTTFLRLRHQDK